MKQISPEEIIPLDLFTDTHDIRIDLDYASADNIAFQEIIYHKNARLWGHIDLVRVAVKASEMLSKNGYRVVAFDCLRTSDAQEKMLFTKRVQENPHWLEEPRLLSPPGQGAHPRGMAIDMTIEHLDGTPVDMGTPFDYLSEDSAPDSNKAHRQHPTLTETVRKNRFILEDAMVTAARTLGLKLAPLPEEWWDFRFGPEIYNQYYPLSDQDLPMQMRMVDPAGPNDPADFDQGWFEAKKEEILQSIDIEPVEAIAQ